MHGWGVSEAKTKDGPGRRRTGAGSSERCVSARVSCCNHAMSALCRRVNHVPACCPRRYTKANLRAHIQHCAQAIAADEQPFRKLPSRQLKNREVKTIARINAQNATNGSHRVVVKNSKDRGMGGVGRCLGGIDPAGAVLGLFLRLSSPALVVPPSSSNLSMGSLARPALWLIG